VVRAHIARDMESAFATRVAALQHPGAPRIQRKDMANVAGVNMSQARSRLVVGGYQQRCGLVWAASSEQVSLDQRHKVGKRRDLLHGAV